MKRTTLIGLAASVFLFAGAIQAQTFTGVDLGTPNYPGSVTDDGGGVKTIVGGGADIWGTADAGYYYYTTVTDPVFDAIVHVRDLVNPDGNDDGWTKCELMVRVPDSTGLPQANDPFIAMMTTRLAVANEQSDTGVNIVRPQYRTARAGNADQDPFGLTVRPAYPGTWLRVQRVGSVFSLYYGSDGTTWTKYGDLDTAKTDVVGADNGTVFGDPWPETVVVGIAVTAHDNNDTTGGIATISNLSVTATPTTPNLAILEQPQDATAVEGSAAYFHVVATNQAIANGLVGGLQWFMDGKEMPGAVGSRFGVIMGQSDNGKKVYCRASVKAGLL